MVAGGSIVVVVDDGVVVLVTIGMVVVVLVEVVVVGETVDVVVVADPPVVVVSEEPVVVVDGSVVVVVGVSVVVVVVSSAALAVPDTMTSVRTRHAPSTEVMTTLVANRDVETCRSRSRAPVMKTRSRVGFLCAPLTLPRRSSRQRCDRHTWHREANTRSLNLPDRILVGAIISQTPAAIRGRRLATLLRLEAGYEAERC